MVSIGEAEVRPRPAVSFEITQDADPSFPVWAEKLIYVMRDDRDHAASARGCDGDPAACRKQRLHGP